MTPPSPFRTPPSEMSRDDLEARVEALEAMLGASAHVLPRLPGMTRGQVTETLALLLTAPPGVTVRRDKLAAAITLDWERPVPDQQTYVVMTKLRNVLERAGFPRTAIVSEWGVGWRLDPAWRGPIASMAYAHLPPDLRPVKPNDDERSDG